MFAVANLLVLNLSTCTLHNFSYFSSDYFKSVFFCGFVAVNVQVKGKVCHTPTGV